MIPTANEATAFRRVAHWVEDYWPNLLSALGVVGMAAIGLTQCSKKDGVDWLMIIIFAVSAGIFITGNVASWKRSGRLTQLERSSIELNNLVEQFQSDYIQLIEQQLSILANDLLNLGDTERVSLYKHDGQAFVMLGRYSKHPEYSKRGRGIYPDTEGCISDAWTHGESIISDLPDPTSDADSYEDQLKSRWHMNKTVVRNLKMKSRSYFGFAIEDVTGVRVAVIIFESTSCGALAIDSIRSTLNASESKRLADLMSRMRLLEPTPTIATRMGY